MVNACRVKGKTTTILLPIVSHIEFEPNARQKLSRSLSYIRMYVRGWVMIRKVDDGMNNFSRLVDDSIKTLTLSEE